MNELNRLSASEQVERMRRREVSVQTVLEAHLDEIARREPTINAFVTVDADRARCRAEALDRAAARGDTLGPLFGLTVGIKDGAPVAGLRWTRGSEAYADVTAEVTALHVANLEDAGAIVLGKTNLPELGHGRYGGQTDNAVAGLTRNPLDPSKTVSSSSGGSAAALAAHFVALADGSDIAGSIRGPAAWCGLYGLRPTPGVVPNWPKADPFEGTDVVGPMARTARDLALMFDAMRGPRMAPLYTVPAPVSVSESPFQGLRVAWCLRPDGADTSEAVTAALSPLRAQLTRLGAVVRDAEPDLRGLHAAQATLRDVGVVVKHGEAIDANPSGFSPELHAALARGREVTSASLCQSTRVRDRCVHTVHAFFADHDVMVWPTSTRMPFGADAEAEAIHEDWRPIELTPCLHLPALAVPVGRTPDGMPCGVQLIGPLRADARLLALATALEAALVPA
ncbi:MAG: amidase [Pseudomonadota bacterium]